MGLNQSAIENFRIASIFKHFLIKKTLIKFALPHVIYACMIFNLVLLYPALLAFLMQLLENALDQTHRWHHSTKNTSPNQICVYL